MLPRSRLPSILLGTGATAASVFTLYHLRAMGGKGSLVRQQRQNEHMPEIFQGGDLFELDVPRSYLRSSTSSDPVTQLAQAFFTAPFFTMERSLIDMLRNRHWPQQIDSETSFEVGSKHAMWTVMHHKSNSMQLEWGRKPFGGFSNFAVVLSGDDDDVVTLQFGSRLHSYDHPAFVNELHYLYSKLLLAQAAKRLHTMSLSQLHEK